eukprot:6204080-Pleurochrysis_carterae.AAC.1
MDADSRQVWRLHRCTSSNSAAAGVSTTSRRAGCRVSTPTGRIVSSSSTLIPARTRSRSRSRNTRQCRTRRAASGQIAVSTQTCRILAQSCAQWQAGHRLNRPSGTY